MTKKNQLLLLIAILVLAAFLRLYRIVDYMTFLGDEGRDALVVKRIIVDHKLTLLGPTASVGGFFLGPFYYYLMIPFLWAWRLNPVGPAVMVALFGIATVYLIYKTAHGFFDAKTGLIAAFLYAISPLVITYSHSSWNPNLMPFFSLLIIWLSWKAVIEKKPKLLFLIGILFGILIQLHYLALFLAVIIAVYFISFWRFNYLKNYFEAALGFVVGWSPFLLFELRHSFPNFETLYQFIFFGKETGFIGGKFVPTLAQIVFRLFSRLVTNNQILLAYFLIIISFSLIGYYWLKSKKQEKINKTFSLLGLWLILGIFLFGFYKKPVYDYYLGFMFPLPFLLTAFSLSKISQKGKLGLGFAYFLIILLGYFNLKGNPFRYQPNRQLEQTRQIAKVIFEQIKGEPFNFALITDQNSDHAYRYFLEVWGAQPKTIENTQIDPQRKSVTDQLMVVCESADCRPLGHPLWEIAGFGRAEIVGEWLAPAGIKVIKLRHYQGE